MNSIDAEQGANSVIRKLVELRVDDALGRSVGAGCCEGGNTFGFPEAFSKLIDQAEQCHGVVATDTLAALGARHQDTVHKVMATAPVLELRGFQEVTPDDDDLVLDATAMGLLLRGKAGNANLISHGEAVFSPKLGDQVSNTNNGKRCDLSGAGVVDAARDIAVSGRRRKANGLVEAGEYFVQHSDTGVGSEEPAGGPD